jgi:hypothetical protein
MGTLAFIVSVSSAGLRRQIAFVSDGQFENCQDDRWGGGFRTQTGVSEITAHYPSNVLGPHSCQKQPFVRTRYAVCHPAAGQDVFGKSLEVICDCVGSGPVGLIADQRPVHVTAIYLLKARDLKIQLVFVPRGATSICHTLDRDPRNNEIKCPREIEQENAV